MAGLTHLKDLYDGKGLSFVQTLFRNKVYVSEKIDGSRFAFKRVDDDLVFYKRDMKNPINMIDRTMMKMYEPAIQHIEGLNRSSIPKNVLFGFEYFANNNPGSIVYDKLPKNGLILTDVSKNGNMVTDVNKLNTFSKLLKVSPPPVIFYGKLSAEQRVKLTEFLMTPWDDLFNQFETESFTSYIISILNPSLKSTALHNGTSKAIEGIVFSFDNGGTFVNAKVVDPMYTKKAREKTQSRYTPEAKQNNSNLKQLHTDLITFIIKKGDFDFKTKQIVPELKMVEGLSYLFLQFYEKNKEKFSKIEPYSGPEISELDVNYNFIPIPELVKILKSKPKVKRVYKSFLGLFGKDRKRGTNAIDKKILPLISDIKNKLKRMNEEVDPYDIYLKDLL